MRIVLAGWIGIAVVMVSFGQQAELLLFSEKIHDFGQVAETGGNVEYTFTFTNNAGRKVRIVSVQPSCGCTTPDWSRDVIAPGKSGFIKVAFHPVGKPGYFNKSLAVVTDLDGNTITLQIKGEVVAAAKSKEDIFAADHGNLRTKVNSFNLARVFINQDPVVKEFEIYNGGKKEIRFTQPALSPAYIKVETPAVLAPQATAKLKISYDAKAKNQYGFVSDNIELITDDEGFERKPISVYATIEEYFPQLSADELAKGPQLRLQLAAIDLGRTLVNQPLKGELRIANTGKKELLIHALQPNCTCVDVHAEKMKLKGGEEMKLMISFNGQGRTGTHQKAITIYSNDPLQPVQRIGITAYIEE